MSDARALRRLFVLSVRRRVFGGFALVLALLGVLAAGALHGLDSVGGTAALVSRDSAQATAATDVALQVADARARVLQYVLSGITDDQAAAQAGLAGLDRAIAGDRSSTTKA